MTTFKDKHVYIIVSHIFRLSEKKLNYVNEVILFSEILYIDVYCLLYQ